MATNKNITMKQFNGVDYDTLYPKTIASQIDDVYSKDETNNLFLPKAGGSMGGILDMNGNRITNLPTPSSNSDPATKEYVDGKFSDPLFGMTKIATFTPTNWQINTNFSTIKLAKICIKIDITRFEWSGAGYYLNLEGSNIQNAIYFIESRSGTGYGSAINTILSYYPSFIQSTGGITYLNYYSSGGPSFTVKPNATYNKISLNGGSYTGIIELYAKWYN